MSGTLKKLIEYISIRIYRTTYDLYARISKETGVPIIKLFQEGAELVAKKHDV